MQNIELEQAVFKILSLGPISEYDLIKTLQKAPYSLVNEDAFCDELMIFRTHFILYNCLFVIRDRGLANNQFDIDILPTAITLSFLSSTEGKSNLISEYPETEKLREYYLDWSNFDETDKDDVDALINSFWQLMGHQRTFDLTTNNTKLALNVMGFDAEPDLTSLKVRFKTLSLQHHPDKGGDVVEFQAIQSAYGYLKKSLQN